MGLFFIHIFGILKVGIHKCKCVTTLHKIKINIEHYYSNMDNICFIWYLIILNVNIRKL